MTDDPRHYGRLNTGRSDPWSETQDAGALPLKPRTFLSKEAVWATCEVLARELGIPIDELVNRAMADYARARGYNVGDDGGAPGARWPGVAPTLDSPRMTLESREERNSEALDRSYLPRRTVTPEEADLARTSGRAATAFLPRELPKAPVSLGAPASPLGSPVPKTERWSPMRPAISSAPPPLAPLAPPLPPTRIPPARSRASGESAREGISPSSSSAKRLTLEYRGKQFPVEKDRFLIGRSKQQADLRLDDPNVSRQHIAIERVGAAWYVVDLGSTNGVEVGGERVKRRALSHDDLIVITTHELRCSLQ
jgi:hypothetical protein